ncbi:hypothetical protein [Niallia sp. FSL W8-1348]|uniref:hypothetical protein n=1 Tax=Niallia sp. FSL W8-1348 TaxID=2954656 RepID=UPI0030FA4103
MRSKQYTNLEHDIKKEVMDLIEQLNEEKKIELLELIESKYSSMLLKRQWQMFINTEVV